MTGASPRQLNALLDSLSSGNRPTSLDLTALSDLGREEAAALRERWPGLPDEVRRSVLERMLKIAEDNVDLDLSALAKVALRDTDSKVRLLAVEALWESSDRMVAQELVNLLQSDPDDCVRAAAAGTLGQFVLQREFEAIAPQIGDDVVAALRETVRRAGEPVTVRARALESLGARNLRWVEDLISESYSSDEREMRLAAIRAMGESAEDAWLEYLYEQLQSDDSEFRYEALNACGQIGAEEAVDAVAELLRDEDMEVTGAAVRALGQIGGRQALRYLQDAAGQLPAAMVDVVVEAIEAASFVAEVEEGEEEW